MLDSFCISIVLVFDVKFKDGSDIPWKLPFALSNPAKNIPPWIMGQRGKLIPGRNCYDWIQATLLQDI